MSSTLDELVFYCKKENPIGAMVLYGESGCGKTYLIEKELREALRDTHFIVRVSLFGINSIDALHSIVKKQWLCAMTPLLSKVSNDPEQMEKGRSVAKALTVLLRTVNPQAGSIAKALTESLDYVVITPVAEDVHSKEKKRVVLVFDDMDRAKLNWSELLGCINEYCENMHFSTIIVANREQFGQQDPANADIVRAAKEKTVAYTVLNCPDYERVVHSVIADRTWKTEEYAEFLKEHERTIIELFGSDTPETGIRGAALAKQHNLRSLVSGLESFFRIYFYLTRAEIPDLEPYLCAFLPCYLAERSGIYKSGKTCYDAADEELRTLYPRFCAEYLFESVRQWIRFGYWDKKLFLEELSRVSTVDVHQFQHNSEDELG